MYEKPNPLTFKRPSRTIRDLELTDSNLPGTVIKMRLRALDAIDASNATVLAKELADKYIYGDMPFPAIDGETVQLNEELLQGIAMAYCSQCGTDEEKFSPEEIIAIGVTAPEIWYTIGNTVGELVNNSVWGKAMGIVTQPATLSSDGENDIQN